MTIRITFKGVFQGTRDIPDETQLHELKYLSSLRDRFRLPSVINGVDVAWTPEQNNPEVWDIKYNYSGHDLPWPSSGPSDIGSNVLDNGEVIASIKNFSTEVLRAAMKRAKDMKELYFQTMLAAHPGLLGFNKVYKTILGVVLLMSPFDIELGRPLASKLGLKEPSIGSGFFTSGTPATIWLITEIQTRNISLRKFVIEFLPEDVRKFFFDLGANFVDNVRELIEYSKEPSDIQKSLFSHPELKIYLEERTEIIRKNPALMEATEKALADKREAALEEQRKKDAAAAAESLPSVLSKIDKLAKKGVIHKNKAANLKSKLTKAVSSKKAA
jgi:small subunit ribosomal protein S20